METIKFPISNLTDEEILKEFVKRFECDGAVLIYMESNTEYGFGRWKNSKGKEWVNSLFKTFKKDIPYVINSSLVETEINL